MKLAKPKRPWPYDYAYPSKVYSDRILKFSSFGLAELIYGMPRNVIIDDPTGDQDNDQDGDDQEVPQPNNWYVILPGDTKIIQAEDHPDKPTKYPIFYGVRRPHLVYMKPYCIGIIDSTKYYWIFDYTPLMHSGYAMIHKLSAYPRCSNNDLTTIKEGILNQQQ